MHGLETVDFKLQNIKLCCFVSVTSIEALSLKLLCQCSHAYTVNDKSFTVRKFSQIFSKLRMFSLLNFCSSETELKF